MTYLSIKESGRKGFRNDISKKLRNGWVVYRIIESIESHDMTKCYSLTNINCSGGGKISADAEVKSDSPWLSGHFPDAPILPGIAQLAMVFDTIKRGCQVELRISVVRRVRFKQIVKPEDRLKLTVHPISESSFSYSFQIMLKDEIACSGTMILNR